jgi:membrane protease YdiL (CAAX protease family)
MKRRSLQPILLALVTGIGLAVSWIVAYSAIVTIALFGYLVLGLIFLGFSWQSIGIKQHSHWTDLKNSWYLIVLVSVVGPTAVFVGSQIWFPALHERILQRAIIAACQLGFCPSPILLLFIMAIVTFVEELVYRAFLQDRFGRHLNRYLSVTLSAILFGYSHWGPPPDALPVMLADVCLVVLDGVVFGLIYLRTRNLLLTWLTHYGGNLVSLPLLFLF